MPIVQMPTELRLQIENGHSFPRSMTIYRLLETYVFGPELATVMTTAYEDVMRVLNLVDPDDPLTNIIARRITELALSGENDPRRIRDRVLHSLDGDKREGP